MVPRPHGLGFLLDHGQGTSLNGTGAKTKVNTVVEESRKAHWSSFLGFFSIYIHINSLTGYSCG